DAAIVTISARRSKRRFIGIFLIIPGQTDPVTSIDAPARAARLATGAGWRCGPCATVATKMRQTVVFAP
ncbi:MAG: hypothetical protein ACRCSO_05560, partial [Sphingomonas sp.]